VLTARLTTGPRCAWSGVRDALPFHKNIMAAKVDEAAPPLLRRAAAARRPVAVVLVLGDVGRSPRMQYHALSLAEHGYAVHLVGHGGTRPPARLAGHPHLVLHTLAAPWRVPERAPRAVFVAVAPFRVLVQLLLLMWTLLVTVPRPAVLLVQTPPAIPTLVVARAVCALRGTRLVVDWHNYGYTLLGLRLGPRHALVRLARVYEHWAGHRAGAHLCVTQAMARDLADGWGVTPPPVVVYDTAPRHFNRLTWAERVAFFARDEVRALFSAVPGGGAAVLNTQEDSYTLPLPAGATGKGKGRAAPAADHKRTPGVPTALLVSSTSWTEDEDFGMLLEAATAYGAGAGADAAHLCIVVTGQGPLRAHYEARFAAVPLPRVTFVTAWLAAEDYPRLLGAADLGVCLHTSSSGLDLPMKVVDMFGCGLPVCAVDYACIGELVRDGHTGRLFTSGAQLGAILLRLFGQGRGSAGARELAALQENVLAARRDTWEDAWHRTVLPVIQGP
jgi:beta-1,4-mannosyltransferase